MTRSFEDLEGDICELVNMAGLVSSFAEGQTNLVERKACGVPFEGKVAVLSADAVDDLMFGVYEFRRMAQKLKERFFEIQEQRDAAKLGARRRDPFPKSVTNSTWPGISSPAAPWQQRAATSHVGSPEQMNGIAAVLYAASDRLAESSKELDEHVATEKTTEAN